jgi:hypothetical protein
MMFAEEPSCRLETVSGRERMARIYASRSNRLNVGLPRDDETMGAMKAVQRDVHPGSSGRAVGVADETVGAQMECVSVRLSHGSDVIAEGTTAVATFLSTHPSVHRKSLQDGRSPFRSCGWRAGVVHKWAALLHTAWRIGSSQFGQTPAMEPAFSDDFMRQALGEADRLATEAARLRQEAARHEDAARRASSEALIVEQQVRELRSMVGPEAPRQQPARTELRGQQVRDKAVEVLLRHRGPMTPIHYRQWHELLQRQGHRVAGQDSLATFLTQVRRSPLVRPVPDRSGHYLVDPEGAATEAVAAVRQAEAKVAELIAMGASAREVERGRRLLAKAERSLLEVARWQSHPVPARPFAVIAGGDFACERQASS